jgi:hypothetical protein
MMSICNSYYKGLGHKINFFKALKIKPILCVHLKFLLASLKIFTNSEGWSESHIRISVQLPFLSLVNFPPFSGIFSGSQA